MTLEDWGRYWRDAIVWSQQQNDPGAFSGGVSVRIAPVGFAPGDDLGGDLQLEAGVLTLIDKGRDQSLFALVPIWNSQKLRVPATQAEAHERDSRVAAETSQRGLQMLTLANPGGHPQTVFVRSQALPAAALLADGATDEYGEGVERFSPQGMEAVGAFLHDVATVNRIFFETGASVSGGGAAAAAAPPRKNRTTLFAWLGAVAVVVLLLVVGTIAGFARGYSHEVVVQTEQEEIQEEQPTGVYDVISTDDRICGDDEDYKRCVDDHVKEYDKVCAGRELTFMGETICNGLDQFIEQAKAEYKKCGAGCRTSTSAGSWGSVRFEVEEQTEMVVVQEYRPEVTRTEHCAFDLGPITFGSCPR